MGFKGAEATKTKAYFFYSNLYIHVLWSCCEDIFKFVYIVAEKIGK